MSLSEIFSYLHGSGVEKLIKHGGIPIMGLIVFAETGLLVGCFLPGDTMLFLAGVLAATHLFNFWRLVAALSLAAIAGDQVGYFLGYECGPAIFSRKDGRFFKRKYAQDAHEFYERHGTFAVIIARFLPMFRTFVPFMAGVAKMEYKRYFIVDCFGGALWILTVVGAGYLLGAQAQPYIPVILPTISFISFLPLIIGIYKKYYQKKSS